jgi:Zn finger protein HypA/HybF involved in hydrogenase expression
MDTEDQTMDMELTLDGNAAGGLLQEIFAMEMTASPAECANCGNVSAVGGLVAYTQAPGTVLRCPACSSVMMRIVETPRGILFEARGVRYIELKK